MTTIVQDNKILLECDGSETEFDFSFKYLVNTDIKVYVVDKDEIATEADLQIEGSDYTLTSTDKALGGTITFGTAPATTKQVFIVREVPLSQSIPFRPNTNFPEQIIETSLDKLTLLAQQAVEKISRCLSFGINSSSIGLEVPEPIADNYLGWDTTGTELENKAFAVPSGDLSESTSSVLEITGGTDAVLGSGTSIQVKKATASVSGYLGNEDFTDFQDSHTKIDNLAISNPVNNGAVLDGVTDDTDALTGAIAEFTTSKNMLIPAGTLLTDAVTGFKDKNGTVKGVGLTGGTTLKNNASDSSGIFMDLRFTSDTPNQAFNMTDMYLDNDFKRPPVITTVNQDSISGQKLLYVADTSDFVAGMFYIVDPGGVREELAKVASIDTGVSITCVEDLVYEHTASDADEVRPASTNLWIEHVHNGQFDNLKLLKGDIGLYLDDTWCQSFRNIIAAGTHVGVYLNGSNHINKLDRIDAYCVDPNGYCVVIKRGNDGQLALDLQGVGAEFSPGGGILIDSGGGSVRLNDCYLGENIGKSVIEVREGRHKMNGGLLTFGYSAGNTYGIKLNGGDIALNQVKINGQHTNVLYNFIAPNPNGKLTIKDGYVAITTNNSSGLGNSAYVAAGDFVGYGEEYNCVCPSQGRLWTADDYGTATAVEYYATVDQDSASGQPTLYVDSTSQLSVGQTLYIEDSVGGSEFGVVSTIDAGVSVTLTEDLAYSHTATDNPRIKDGYDNSLDAKIVKCSATSAGTSIVLLRHTIDGRYNMGDYVYAIIVYRSNKAFKISAKASPLGTPDWAQVLPSTAGVVKTAILALAPSNNLQWSGDTLDNYIEIYNDAAAVGDYFTLYHNNISDESIRGSSALYFENLYKCVSGRQELGSEIDGATSKATPADADKIPISDSVASKLLKYVSWANIKATLKTYFDTLYSQGNYTLQAGHTSATPADTATLYFGLPLTLSTTTGAALRKIYIPKAGTITSVYGAFFNTAGTAETSSLYIRLNNTTDYLVSDSVVHNAAGGHNPFSNTGLNIPVVAGDYIEFKWITPTWVTNPTGVLSTATVNIEV